MQRSLWTDTKPGTPLRLSHPGRHHQTSPYGNATVKKAPCDCGITLVQRHGTRQIRNLDAIASSVEAAFPSETVKVVAFENLTLREQIYTAQCTKVLVGVHGAALAWGIAMSPSGGLVEIAWDGHPGYYSCQREEPVVTSCKRGGRHVKRAALVYTKGIRRGPEVEARRAKLFPNGDPWGGWGGKGKGPNLNRIADVEVPPQAVVLAIKRMMPDHNVCDQLLSS